jgi:hypothetical protein
MKWQAPFFKFRIEEKKQMKRITALATCFVLLMAMAAFAQAKKTTPAAPKAATATTKTASGTIVSADATTLVLTHKVNAKDVEMTFVLDAKTKTTGAMVKDAKVTVHYTVDGTTNKATSVTATPAKAAAPAKATAPKKAAK